MEVIDSICVLTILDALTLSERLLPQFLEKTDLQELEGQGRGSEDPLTTGQQRILFYNEAHESRLAHSACSTTALHLSG